MPLAELLATRDGIHGIIVSNLIIDRMGIDVGDRARDRRCEVRGPRRSRRPARPGNAGLPDRRSDADVDRRADGHRPDPSRRPRPLPLQGPLRSRRDLCRGARSKSAAPSPTPSWDIRSPTDATETLASFFSVFTRFLVIVGLSSLLVGGVGVSNAVGAYIIERQRSIATLRSLGATSARILTHFLFQIMLLTLLGILIGLALGAVLSLIALPIIGNLLSIQLDSAVHPSSLLTAAGFGLLVGFAFAFLPLARAKSLQAGAAVPLRRRRGRHWLALARCARSGRLGAAARRGRWAHRPRAADHGTARARRSGTPSARSSPSSCCGSPPPASSGSCGASRRCPTPTSATPSRRSTGPAAPAPAVILSLGLGLALLLLIALIENNLRTQIETQVQADAPSFILTDLFPDETEALTAAGQDRRADRELLLDPDDARRDRQARGQAGRRVRALPRGHRLPLRRRGADHLGRRLPRGRVRHSTRASGGRPTTTAPRWCRSRPSSATRWAFRIGDTIEVRLFGEMIPATIKSFRRVDWSSGVNFAVIFSPGVIEQFPVNYIGMLKADRGQRARAPDHAGRGLPRAQLHRRRRRHQGPDLDPLDAERRGLDRRRHRRGQRALRPRRRHGRRPCPARSRRGGDEGARRDPRRRGPRLPHRVRRARRAGRDPCRRSSAASAPGPS